MDEAHRFQPKQTSNFLNFNNQRMTPQEDFSEKTSVSISDSSDAKPIPNFNQNSPIKKKQQVKINSHKKKSKNLNENDQDAQNYNYNDQQQQSPQQVYQPPPPEIHMDIENAFDMAIDNFYHYFFNELKSILKPSPLPITSPELDNFAYSMIDEIERSLQLPQSSVSQIAISKTNETIDLILKEETSQMAQYLKQKSLRLKAQEERDMVDLQKLGNEVSDLDSQYRKLSIHVLKNLERERIELVKNNETEKERQKALLDSKRNLDLKLLELKAVANRQNNEVLKLQRDENSIYSMREELRENLLDSYDVKYKKLRSKIMNEIRSIADYIDDPIFESISSAAEEIKYKLRFSDNNNDLQQPMFNFQPIFMQYPKQKMLPKQREANENDHGKECINSIANIAMKKLEELRKQREKAFKGVKTSKKKKE
ncbi:hypothetical protein TRFO_21393 [Tritrichomonas foetus]|uniref:Uncharacterized protein n=1 Tax=Tritrichomonas foetus TaxID=1144522 RepID=A0A1J4KFG7_9EUKA|nr:hypothetical protein TRFO_21393 [Tritrichomonas foetus]|eukprot:OHT09672.1 hypothetical protein TRFO_21393 [Tritrichomonas foetus]